MDPITPPPVEPPAQDVPSPASNVKQQIAQRVQAATNILVTVSKNPSVDELASALGLSLLFGKLDKHTTAVFSGKVPSAMEFLEPDHTFTTSVDQLRDFIIALDRNKADKLRYKVEEDVVKIFITPYKTTLSKDDFSFDQGDFNIDVIITLGVVKREDLDSALLAHGRILHDATVITLNAGSQTSSLGTLDWSEASASSLSEMLMSFSESLGSGLVDEQIANAFLTGIVAATNRFSNEKTSPKVMTMAAQLMAAGANQQLIASNLRREGMISESIRLDKKTTSDGDNGEVVVEHVDKSAKNKLKKQLPTSTKPDKAEKVEAENTKQAIDTKVESTESTDDDHKMVEEPSKLPGTPTVGPAVSRPAEDKQPTFGGTLNATTAQAEEEKQAETKREAEVNNVALSHDDSQTEVEPTHDAEAALEEARKAVAEADDAMPFDPGNQPAAASGAQLTVPLRGEQPQPVPSPTTSQSLPPVPVPPPVTTPEPVASKEPEPIDAFMQPHQASVSTTPVTPPSLIQPGPAGMPPLPPLPSDFGGGTLPPLPPLPGQPEAVATPYQPQVAPDFMQNAPAPSQNPWTEAGENVAADQAKAAETRQAKMDKLTEQYDSAVEQNQKLQQEAKNPTDDHSTFPLPR